MSSWIGNVLFCVFMTLTCYLIGLRVFRKYKKVWLDPLYTAPLLLFTFFLITELNTETYQHGSVIFFHLLQLAVVSLAVPLYKQWKFLRNNYQKIFTGVICGTALGVMAVFSLAQIFHLNEEILASLIPRSVTLPIALTISGSLGGISSTTVFFVVTSALISLVIGPELLRQFGITSKSAKGLAMGTSAQMLGANHSLSWGEEEGAMGSVAMTTSALFLSVTMPVLPYLLKL